MINMPLELRFTICILIINNDNNLIWWMAGYSKQKQLQDRLVFIKKYQKKYIEDTYISLTSYLIYLN